MNYSLVLSGGAAYGLANAGVINVLERESLRPTSVAGSSMGAIVGALYAYTADVHILTDLMNKIRAWNIATLSDHPLKSGLHGGIFRQRLKEHLESTLGDATIGDCTIPFTCVAGKILKPIDWTSIVKVGFMDRIRECVELHVFSPNTRLIDAIMASSAIPVVFSPVTIGNDSFIDLVHFGAIPARTVRDTFHPDVIIATDTTPRYPVMDKFLPAPWKEFLQEGYAELNRSKEACDLIITPSNPAGLFRFDKAAAFAQAGEEATEKHLDEIRSILA